MDNPIVYVLLSIALGIGSVVGSLLKAPPFLRTTVRSARKAIVKERDIDQAIERLISGNGELTPFMDWVSNLLTRLIVNLPSAFDSAQIPSLMDILSIVFGDLSQEKASSLLPSLPEEVMADEDSRFLVARKILSSTGVREKVISNASRNV
jgi:hypothetical protein